MLKLTSVASVLALGLADTFHPINEDIVTDIKTKTDKWTPYEPTENPLTNKSHVELFGLLGTITRPAFGDRQPEMENVDLPKNFDSREQWPKCIHAIRDQAQCGSCWAFGASEVLSDRFCIASKAEVNVVLSPEDMVECDKTDYGCQGGILYFAWEYLETTGIATDQCIPYTSGAGKVDTCPVKCADGSKLQKYKCEADSIVEATNQQQIQQQLYKQGPMETGFQVYQDFFSYKGGIYHHVTGALAGGHAVKIVGWGSEAGTDYWICANSWGPKWGENGFFRIEVGDSGIDQSVWACTPELEEQLAFE